MHYSLASTSSSKVNAETGSEPPGAVSSARQLTTAPSLNSPDSNASTLSTPSLAAIWAKKYVNTVAASKDFPSVQSINNLAELDTTEGRSLTARKLLKHLTLASALAWSLTETLLSTQITRHQIDPELIDPWKIAADSHTLFQKALQAYAEQVTPQRLSVLIGSEFGQVRQHYTAVDPRVLGFVSMQFHYTGRKLLERLSPQERSLFEPYLKVMDDHLYMPLRHAYEAAARHQINSPKLVAVQHLLPLSTTIAHAVCQQVSRTHLGYQSYSGSLNAISVRTSSVRDVEMFQVYLCLCALEGDVQWVQQELFPLCVMLYPPLRVSWKLVQDMLVKLAWELHDRLNPADREVFIPYVQTLSEMFSPQVFQDI